MLTNTAKRLSRQEIYDLVWSEPIKTIASRFGISDVAFRKKCVKALVPTPERGYWAKIEAGKPATQVPLPKRAPGQDDEVLITGGDRHWYGGYDEAELLGSVPDPPVFSETIEEVRAHISGIVGEVVAPREVRSWAIPIARLLGDDEKRREKHRNSAYPSSLDKPLFNSPFERRRLRILNALSIAVGNLDGQMYISDKEGRGVRFAVGDRTVSVDVDAPRKRGREHPSITWSPREEDAGLVFSIEGSGHGSTARSWIDEGSSKIESKLTEIAVEIVTTAEIKYREAKIHDQKWRVERKAQLEEAAKQKRLEELRVARERREQLEQARIDRLLRDATFFREASDIRQYVEQVCMVKSDPDASRNDKLDGWCTWALAQADRIDPSAANSYLLSMDDDLPDKQACSPQEVGSVGQESGPESEFDAAFLQREIARLQQQNKALHERLDALSRQTAASRPWGDDALIDQRQNFFKYRNVGRNQT